MRIGLIDVDAMSRKRAKYPNLALMKLSAWHKKQGDEVEWWNGLLHYDRVYVSKVFSDSYAPDIEYAINADEVIRGGSGYCIDTVDGVEEYRAERDTNLPEEIEHIYPDYDLYPELTKDTAYGFLTRGCPRGCHFCVVGEKEGRRSRKVADLSEWWSGQKNIVLMDPNILAYKGHMQLLQQLIDSKASVDINQGVDCRLLNEDNISALNAIKLKEIHFAWDYMKESKQVLRGLELYRKLATRKPHGAWGTVYVLVNHDTTMEENLYRIYTLRDMGYDPYVMIYNKPSAPKEIRDLQRWCNNRFVFKAQPDFSKYDPKGMRR